ncbi:MAG: glycosyltransferase family 39 protein [Candidatus Micrarchaeia archaeon]
MQPKTRAERHATRRNARKIATYVVLAAILAYALIYSVVNAGGPSFYGDDTTYLGLANSVLTHTFAESSYIFSIRLLQIYPIAFFYAVFGVSKLSSSAWDISAFVLTIAVIFFIGKELYGDLAGLISSFLYSVFPLVVRLSATVSDDVTMTFVASFAVLAIIMGEKYDSRKWYFLGGALALASPLVTPEGAIIIVFLALFLAVEFARKKIKIKSGLFAICGFFVAVSLLLLINSVLTSPPNPLVTLTVSSHFYGAVGKANTIPSTNTNLNFYIQTMFPYGIVQQVVSGLRNGNLASAFVFLNPLYFVPNSRVGFFMYAFVAALAYLLIKRERRAYVPIFWFFVCFLYLELGPMHVSISPFSYLLSYRLGRFLVLIAPPVALTIGMAVARSVEKGKRAKRYAGIAVSVIGLAVLVYSSVLINNFWHETLVSQTYDQIEIAKYISGLPSATKIYFSGFASLVPIYSHFDNLSRFFAYDNIKNCSGIPVGSYVILPYFNLFGLNYTYDPSAYCPGWQLVYAPQPEYLPKQFEMLSEQLSEPFEARLYFVAYNGVKPVPIHASNSSATNRSLARNAFNFFNLTGVGVYNSTLGRLTKFVLVNNVSNVTVTLNKTVAAPGNYVSLTVTFAGHFLWSGGTPASIEAASAYLAEPVINIHYFGVELANETSRLLVQNNGPWQKYVTQIGEPHQYLSVNESKYLPIVWVITPNATLVGKTLKICGGYFAAYENTSLDGGWGNLYDKLAYERAMVVNESVINVPSQTCAELNVS